MTQEQIGLGETVVVSIKEAPSSKPKEEECSKG
jgi:hypothetical protein